MDCDGNTKLIFLTRVNVKTLHTMICRYILFITMLPLLWGCEQQEARIKEQEIVQVKRGTIVAMGNSLTAGFGVSLPESYPALLEKALQERQHNYRVINSGVSGETSSGALSRLSWVLSMNPDILILETGANDGLRGLPPSMVKENIGMILKQLQERKIVTVLAGMQMVGNMGEEYTSEFKKVYGELATEFDVVYFPFFLEGVATRQELNQADGIHPNALGYQRITETILPYVLEAITRNERRKDAG